MKRTIFLLAFLAAVQGCEAVGALRTHALASPAHFDEVFARLDSLSLQGTQQAPLFSVAPPFFAKDRVYIPDLLGHRIYVFDFTGRLVRSVGGKGVAAGQFQMPYGVTVDQLGDIYVNDRGNQRIQIFDSAFRHRQTISAPGQNEQMFIRRSQSQPHILMQGVGRCAHPNGCLFQAYKYDGTRIDTYAEVRDEPPVFTWRAAVSDDGTIYLANTVGDHLDILTASGDLHRRVRFDSPSHLHFRAGEAVANASAMTAMIKRLSREKYTRIESITVSGDKVLVQLQRVNPDVGEAEYTLDVYDRTGHFLSYGLVTPGILLSSDRTLFFIQKSKSGYGRLTMLRVALR